jgi:hypothetical protein
VAVKYRRRRGHPHAVHLQIGDRRSWRRELGGELVVAAASRVGGSGIIGGIDDDPSVVPDFLVTLKGVIDTPRRKSPGMKAALRGSSVSPQLAAASPP